MGQIFKIDGKWVNEWMGGTVASLKNCLAQSKNYRFTIEEEKMFLHFYYFTRTKINCYRWINPIINGPQF